MGSARQRSSPLRVGERLRVDVFVLLNSAPLTLEKCAVRVFLCCLVGLIVSLRTPVSCGY